MKKAIALLLVFAFLISTFTACKSGEDSAAVIQKNTPVSVISDAEKEEVLNYVAALKCEDGGYREVSSSVGGILYDTYYCMLVLKQLDQLLFEEYSQLLVKEYLSKDFELVVDLTYEDIVVYFYYYTELCGMCNYQISDKDKEKMRELTEQARTVYGGYYYSGNHQIEETEQNVLLYSTEKAVKVLHNIGVPIDKEYCKKFIDNYMEKIVPGMELYNKISAYDSMLSVLDICGFAGDDIQKQAEALLSENWGKIIREIKGKEIDLFAIGQLPHLCRRLNYYKINELYAVLEGYYQSLAAPNGFYCGFSQDGINILVTQMVVEELTAMQKDASVAKSKITDKIIQNKIYRSGFLAPERERPSVIYETYSAYRILKMLGETNDSTLEYLSNLDVASLEQTDLFYYYEFMHTAGLDIKWTQREEEIKTSLLKSLEDNPLQTDMEYYQMLNALQTLYSLKVSIPENLKNNLTEKIKSANGMYQNIVALLLYYYADIEQAEQVQKTFQQATSLLQNEIQKNKENVFGNCILLYYYYLAVDLWGENLAEQIILQIAKQDIQPMLSDYLRQGGGGGLALTNIYTLLYLYNKGV